MMIAVLSYCLHSICYFKYAPSTAIAIACIKKVCANMKLAAVPKEVTDHDQETKLHSSKNTMELHSSKNTIKPSIGEMEKSCLLNKLKAKD